MVLFCSWVFIRALVIIQCFLVQGRPLLSRMKTPPEADWQGLAQVALLATPVHLDSGYSDDCLPGGVGAGGGCRTMLHPALGPISAWGLEQLRRGMAIFCRKKCISCSSCVGLGFEVLPAAGRVEKVVDHWGPEFPYCLELQDLLVFSSVKWV